jgi:type I restriction enzyme, R subunit
MRQAIEEGFILDVLKNYTIYSTYYRLLKAAQDDPEVEKKKAVAKRSEPKLARPAHNAAENKHLTQKRDLQK